jgi:hypothetical protein
MPDVLGLEVADVPEGWTPVRCLLIVESFVPTDEDTRKLSLLTSVGMTTWDVMGMARAAGVYAEAQWLATDDADE